MRIFAALGLLLGAKIATLFVPLFYKRAVDALSLRDVEIALPVGLIVAYAGRGGSDGLSRAHIDAQIRLFWSVFWWTILLWIGIGAWLVSIFIEPAMGLILAPVALLLGLGLLLLTVWFTIRSLIGLFRLLGDKAP